MDGPGPVAPGSGSLRRVNPLLAEVLRGHGGVATVSELIGSGVTRSSLRWAVSVGAVSVVAPATVADAEEWRDLDDHTRHLCLVRCAVRRGGPGAVACAESAAVVWDLPLPDGPPAMPVVLRGRTTGRPQNGGRTGAAVRRRAWLDPADVTERAGIPVTNRGRTAVDLGRSLALPWGTAVADAVLSRGIDVEALDDVLRRGSPVPGSRRARQVLAWADGRSESPLESVARATVRMLGLPAPDPQVWLSSGGLRYRVDLLIPDFSTVIEVDGKVKYQDPDQSWGDKRRRDDLLAWGFDVERFVAADAHRPRRWGRQLVRTFVRQARRHGRAEPDIDLTFPAYGRFPSAWRVDGS